MVQNDKIGQNMTFGKSPFLDQKFEKNGFFEAKKGHFTCIFGPKGVKKWSKMIELWAKNAFFGFPEVKNSHI